MGAQKTTLDKLVILLLVLYCVVIDKDSEKALVTHSSILRGKSHGQRSLVGCSPWGRTESDKTDAT